MPHVESVILDYEDAAYEPKLLRNLSAVAVQNDFLWTASDEGRSIECLKASGDFYRLDHRYALDALFADLPGRESGDEADIEALDFAEGRLWICGSHCRVRRKPVDGGRPNEFLRYRRSRHLLGSVKMSGRGEPVRGFEFALPAKGRGSLRQWLKTDPILEPFMGLASKENGFDIEGFVVVGKSALIGLRGPVIDGRAVVLTVPIGALDDLDRQMPQLDFLDLGGLGIRDLARVEEAVLILAGPVTDASGPFRLHRWRRKDGQLDPLHEWPPGDEKPEGVCPLARGGRPGFLILYDHPNESRIDGTTYRADWLSLA